MVQRNKIASYIWQGKTLPATGTYPSPGRSLSINEMKDAMVRLYDESNAQKFSVFDEMFAPEFVSYGGAGFQDLHGAAEFRQLYVQFLSSMPDLNFRVDLMIAEGNLCGVRGTLSGTHRGNFMGFAPPTMRKITWTGTAIFRFNDEGLMDARWQEWDGLSVMQQMGVIPTPPGQGQEPPEPVPPHVVGGDVSSPSENKATFRRFIEEFWNQGKMEVADEIFHPLATSPSAAALPPGPVGVKIIGRMFRDAMPDYRMEIIDLLADGDYVLARMTQSGTQQGELFGVPATGKKAAWGEIGILRFAGGKVVESWYNVDLLGMMQQLGVGGSGRAGA
jgi:predicted ester cyclase